MSYRFLNNDLDKDSLTLPESKSIDSCLLKNNTNEILKALDFIDSDEKFLYVHGFIGTGKRQFVNYVCEFLNNDVIKLEYFCKESTVCDDILLEFNEIIENEASYSNNINVKITTQAVKFQQNISFIKKPFLIVLHSLDDVSNDNFELISNIFAQILKEENVKIIVSTRALKQNLLGNYSEDRKIFLKALSNEIFSDYLNENNIQVNNKQLEDLYKLTRGYYYYTVLSVKVIQAMNISAGEFIERIKQANVNFDTFIGLTYINLIPNAIRNFFWFLKTIRHGISLNALAILELYDEFSIEYLCSNRITFQANEKLYVHDYFIQKIDTMIPAKTEIRLHKYIINIYENQLKEPIKSRSILISRQALRAEIEFHGKCIEHLEHPDGEAQQTQSAESNVAADTSQTSATTVTDENNNDPIREQMLLAQNLTAQKKYTEAIETYNKLLDYENTDPSISTDIKLNLAQLYKTVGELSNAQRYFESVETYYKKHDEVINLNYLYYELTDLYFKMYKNQRAIETAKKVIYSVDSPQSLMVNACTLLGNIFSEINNPEEAYIYYKKAIESLDSEVKPEVIAELYFKFALANDDREDLNLAFEYYNKCISIGAKNPYTALAYSNLASCYYDQKNYDEAIACFNKAYNIEKENNNYEGIYYITSSIAKIYTIQQNPNVINYLIEAKKSAEFINEPYYVLESSVALGDYYYNDPTKTKEALKEYLTALDIAKKSLESFDITSIEKRVEDMKLRMSPEDFADVKRKYEKQ